LSRSRRLRGITGPDMQPPVAVDRWGLLGASVHPPLTWLASSQCDLDGASPVSVGRGGCRRQVCQGALRDVGGIKRDV
jgi:hypothetical protein